MMNDATSDDQAVPSLPPDVSSGAGSQDQPEVSSESANAPIQAPEIPAPPMPSTNTEVTHQGTGALVMGDNAGATLDKSTNTTTMRDVYNIQFVQDDKAMRGRNLDDLRNFQQAQVLRALANTEQVTMQSDTLNFDLSASGIGRIRSFERGPVLREIQSDWLKDAVRRFVEFDECRAIRQRLREERIIVLQGQDDLLCWQISLWLAWEGLSSELNNKTLSAYHVNMRHGLNDFIDHYPNNEELQGIWYLVNNAPERLFASLTSQGLEQIKHNLEFAKSCLIISVQMDTSVPRLALGRSYWQVKNRAHTIDVIAAYVRSESLSNTERESLLQDITASQQQDRFKSLLARQQQLKDIYMLAERLCSLRRQLSTESVIDYYFAQHQTEQINEWFEQHPEWEIRAYMLSLAVLDGALPEEIDSAYRQLLELWGLEVPAKRPVLAEMLASQRGTYEQTRAGWRRIKVNGFETQGLYGLILFHIWDELYREHNSRLEQLTKWLMLLAISDRERVRNLAARAIGTLANEDFKTIEDKIINPLIQEGAVKYSTGSFQPMLVLLQLFLMAQLENAVTEEALNMTVLLRQLNFLMGSIDQDVQGSQWASRHFVEVIGNIMAYGIESGNERFRTEVLDLIGVLTNAERPAGLIERHGDKILNEFIHQLGKQLDKHFADNVNHLLRADGALLGRMFTEQIETHLIVYQQVVGISAHFYAGGHIVDRVCQDIHRLTQKNNLRYIREIAPMLRNTIRGTINKRLNLPGDPRPQIEKLMGIVGKWIQDGLKYDTKPPNGETILEHELLRLGLDTFMDLATEVTEPLSQVEDTRQVEDRILLTRPYTDWPLLMYLSLYSDATEEVVTRILRYLISRNQPWITNVNWEAYMRYQLDDLTRRALIREQMRELDGWTIRDHGYAVLEYWMLYNVGRKGGGKPEIRAVKDMEAYYNHLERIFAGVLAWLPSEKTRQRLLNQLIKFGGRRQTISDVATKMKDFIENNTDEFGRPRSS